MKLSGYLTAVQNMGWLDRVLRCALGLGLIAAVLVLAQSSEEIGGYSYLLIISIYPLMTAILGWDPLYHAGRVRSCDSSGRNQCGTFPFEIESAMGKKLDCNDGYDCSLAGNQHAHSAHK